MWRRLTESFFFSNYFLGILAIALSLETSFQLSLPVNSLYWYMTLFTAVVLYYTYAYGSIPASALTANPRTSWYASHKKWVKYSQATLLVLFTLCATIFAAAHFSGLKHLPWQAWAVPALTLFIAVAYYGKLPFFNPRRAGWAKALTIGLCWAVAVSLAPLIALQAERGDLEVSPLLAARLFLKNWMFCSANAILFDIKDYADDSNKQLKTFVVRYGIRFTILSILVPMIALGIVSFLFFAHYRHFSLSRIFVNLLPFLLTLYIALSMQKKRSILYYLIVIDGMLLVKALCGITASFLPEGS